MWWRVKGNKGAGPRGLLLPGSETECSSKPWLGVKIESVYSTCLFRNTTQALERWPCSRHNKEEVSRVSLATCTLRSEALPDPSSLGKESPLTLHRDPRRMKALAPGFGGPRRPESSCLTPPSWSGKGSFLLSRQGSPRRACLPLSFRISPSVPGFQIPRYHWAPQYHAPPQASNPRPDSRPVRCLSGGHSPYKVTREKTEPNVKAS